MLIINFSFIKNKNQSFIRKTIEKLFHNIEVKFMLSSLKRRLILKMGLIKHGNSTKILHGFIHSEPYIAPKCLKKCTHFGQ